METSGGTMGDKNKKTSGERGHERGDVGEKNDKQWIVCGGLDDKILPNMCE